jgi:hypothetical protein
VKRLEFHEKKSGRLAYVVVGDDEGIRLLESDHVHPVSIDKFADFLERSRTGEIVSTEVED